MNIFAENKSSKIVLNSFAKEIIEYHTAVITILNEKRSGKLLHNCTIELLNLCNASAGMYCSYNSEKTFTVEYAINLKCKPGKQLIIPSEMIKSSGNSVRTILTDIHFLKLIGDEVITFSDSKNVIISTIYSRRKMYGVFILFDNKLCHRFTNLDFHKISNFSEIIAFTLDNVQSICSNKKKAQMDSLTGLFNHKAFLNKTEFEIKRSLRYKRPLTICMFDVDNFKQINDNYGHLAGDKILVILSEICKKLFRTVDFCARYGGDEYIVLLTETPIEAAKEVLTRLRDTVLSKEVQYQSIRIRFSISIGIAAIDDDCSTAEKLIERADAAMYNAKQSSESKIVLWRKEIFA
jgi:diguanylate cyclase (GGDEF)-like protein